MSELATKLYEHFKSNSRYIYSNDVNIKSLEIDAVKELESDNKIIVKMKTIGYVIAEIS